MNTDSTNNAGDPTDPVALPPDDYRAVIGMARAMTGQDLQAFAALQPHSAGQAHAMLLAAVTVIAALASDTRLDGTDAELARMQQLTVRLEAEGTP